jgi:uncharacterized protein YqeY
MTLETLQKDMISAMKTKDVDRKSVLTSAIGAVKNAAIAKQCRENISEELVNEVLLKEKKTLQEQLDTCPADRLEKRAEFEKKLSIINEYCPKLLDNPSEIETIIFKLCAEASVELTKANRGAVMKTVMPYFKGKADMPTVNKVLIEVLK